MNLACMWFQTAVRTTCLLSCHSWNMTTNLHLDQEWCPDLYWSLVLCNSPKKKTCVNNLSGQDMYHRVYFTESLAEKRDTCTSTTVRKNLHLDQEWCPDLYWSLVLCNSPKKKTCVNNLSGQDMYHRVYFTESLAEKRDTCTSTTVRKNLHLDQEWCPDLYWSLVLCNSPKKKKLVLIIYLGKICNTECISQRHQQKKGIHVQSSTTVKKNLHLDQEWCPDLYWSLILCN